MSNEIFWRMLGERPRPSYPGEAVPIASWWDARIPGAGWLSVAGAFTGIPTLRQYWTGSIGTIAAIDDVLMKFPRHQVFDAVAGIQTPPINNASLFQPGLYRIQLQWAPGTGAAIGSGLILRAIRGDFTTPASPTFAPLPGRAQAWWPIFKPAGATGGTPVGPFVYRFMVLEPWQLWLKAGTALLATDVYSVWLNVDCEIPLDRPEGT